VTDEQEMHWSATVASNPICHDYWRTKWFDVIPPKKLLALLDEVARLREECKDAAAVYNVALTARMRADDERREWKAKHDAYLNHEKPRLERELADANAALAAREAKPC
jgi:hypothetical protein